MTAKKWKAALKKEWEFYEHHSEMFLVWGILLFSIYEIAKEVLK